MAYRRTPVADGVPLPRSIEITDAMARYCFQQTPPALRDGTLEDGFTTYHKYRDGERVPYALYEPVREA